jgi:hypothetical protein
MGYGVIEGRGWDNLIINGTTQDYSWYANTLKAYVARPVLNQSNFNLVDLNQADNFTLYKITLKNSPEFNIHWHGKNGAPATKGLTVWGIKIIAPNNIPNTDGIDPTDNVSDVTITNSFISTGDDHIALSSTAEGYPVSDVSITNLHTYSGFGISIGSRTLGGISDVLVDTVSQAGYYPNQASAGIKIKSSSDRGGVVSNVTYQHICQQNERSAIRIYPYYTKPSTTEHIPTYSNIVIRDFTVIAGAEGKAGSLTFQGFDANHPTTLTLDNLNVMGIPDMTAEKPHNVTLTLGPRSVAPSLLQRLTGTGVSYAGSVTSQTEAPYSCSIASFQPLVGELSITSGSASNLRSIYANASSTFLLQAVLEPASAEYPPLTKPVTFYEGSTVVGAATISGNGTLAELTLSNVSAGTHTYSAMYPADANYAAYSFGNVTVTVHANATGPNLVSAYVVAKGRASSMLPGGTLQFIAYGKYSDGSIATLPDSEGHKVTLWNTTNHSIAKISTLGHATGIGPGTVAIEATVGTIKATPWTVTVGETTALSLTCSATPSVVDPGGTATISANGSSFQDSPITYTYNTSAGTLNSTGQTAKLKTSSSATGLINVTCDATQTDGSSATATTTVLVATASGNLAAASNWKGVHDAGTPGTASGSSLYPVAVTPYNDARKFSLAYSSRGGERFSLSFAHDTTATHFVYDTYIYVLDPTQLANVELDINQVTANGDTVIYGTQCSVYSKTWEYTTGHMVNGVSRPHWNSSNLPCNPTTWKANTWHHIQIASSRNASGVVTYNWVCFDGETAQFANATGSSSFSLGWGIGILNINFQLDGASTSAGTITAFADDLTIYRW